VNIGLEDPVLRLAGGSRARVTARIREEQLQKTLVALPVEVRGGTAQARPGSVRVELSGPASLLRTLDPAKVRPYVTVTKDGLDRAPVAVELSSGLTGSTVVEVAPAEVALRGAQKGP
jgi:hypothetical protein